MKKSNIYLTGAAAIVALAAVASIGFITRAQSDATSAPQWFGRHMGMMGRNLTDEQKTELQTKIEDFKATAETNRQKITDAMTQGFVAWVKAVKEVQGETAPILSKINAGNFNQFAEAHNHMEEARKIHTELGLDQGGFGFGGKGMKGMMGACSGGFKGGLAPAAGVSGTQTQ